MTNITSIWKRYFKAKRFKPEEAVFDAAPDG
jgi:hypothetical protein